MNKYSKCKKLNDVLMSIEIDLKDLGKAEVLHYYNTHTKEKDYNIAQYGRLLVYDYQLRDLYKEYKSLVNWGFDKLWELYKRQVGYVTRMIIKEDF